MKEIKIVLPVKYAEYPNTYAGWLKGLPQQEDAQNLATLEINKFLEKYQTRDLSRTSNPTIPLNSKRDEWYCEVFKMENPEYGESSVRFDKGEVVASIHITIKK